MIQPSPPPYAADLSGAPPAIDRHFGRVRDDNPTKTDVVWAWIKLAALVAGALAACAIGWLVVRHIVWTWQDVWERETKARSDAHEVLATPGCTRQSPSDLPNEVCEFARSIVSHKMETVVIKLFIREHVSHIPFIGQCLVDNDACRLTWLYAMEWVRGSMIYIAAIAVALAACAYFVYTARVARAAVAKTRAHTAGPGLPTRYAPSVGSTAAANYLGGFDYGPIAMALHAGERLKDE